MILEQCSFHPTKQITKYCYNCIKFFCQLCEMKHRYHSENTKQLLNREIAQSIYQICDEIKNLIQDWQKKQNKQKLNLILQDHPRLLQKNKELLRKIKQKQQKYENQIYSCMSQRKFPIKGCTKFLQDIRFDEADYIQKLKDKITMSFSQISVLYQQLKNEIEKQSVDEFDSIIPISIGQKNFLKQYHKQNIVQKKQYEFVMPSFVKIDQKYNSTLKKIQRDEQIQLQRIEQQRENQGNESPKQRLGRMLQQLNFSIINQKNEDALRLIERIIKKTQESYEFLKIKAKILIKLNRFDESLTIYNKFQKDLTIKSNQDFSFQFAFCLFQKNQYQKSYKVLDSIKKSAWKLHHHILKADLQSKLNNHPAALKILQTIYSKNPYQKMIIARIASCYLKLQNYQQSIKHYNKVISQIKNYLYYGELAWAYYKVNQFIKAEENFKLSIQTKMDPKILNNFCILLIKLNKLDEASRKIKQAYTLENSSQVFVNYLKILQLKSDQYSGKQIIDSNKQKFINNHKVVIEMAKFLLKTQQPKNWKEANQMLNQAKNNRKNMDNILEIHIQCLIFQSQILNPSISQIQLKQIKQKLTTLIRNLQINNTELKELINTIQRSITFKLKAYDQCQKIYSAFPKQKNRNTIYYFNQACLFYQSSQFQKALISINKALEIHTHKPIKYIKLKVYILLSSNQKQNSIRFLQDCIRQCQMPSQEYNDCTNLMTQIKSDKISRHSVN